MKKIDFHIHTIPTVRDSNFSFSLESLKKYVSEASLDAIAITNHDMFDSDQFEEIVNALGITVFPGIEVSLDCGHILVLSDPNDLSDFKDKADVVTSKIIRREDCITIGDFEIIFSDLSKYLLIPHYDKRPAISGDGLKRFSSHLSAGEVDSAKKFMRTLKDKEKLTPVLFSDVRVSCELTDLPTRQTFIDCGELSLNAIKACLRDRTKVALTQSDGNKLFQIFDNGQKLSTGLNVLLGNRSSGKTFTLDKIAKTNDNVKYIKQFSLVQQDSDAYERDFNNELQKNKSQFTEEYLADFKIVLNDVMNIDLEANDRLVENYIDSLLKSALEAHMKDEFSKVVLFDESEFSIKENTVLNGLIRSVEQVIENIEFGEIIEKHIDRNALKKLACELIELSRSRELEAKKKSCVNVLIKDIKKSLKMRTSAVQVEEVDLYRAIMEKRKIKRFEKIIKHLQKEETIAEETIQGFTVVAKKGPFAGAGEIKKVSGTKSAFSDVFTSYEQPYSYLRALVNKEELTPSELYRFFVKISYQILNEDGFEVSGGERSEFRLLQEIKDAQNYDILLIDEPESSFDNMFLKSDVNQLIKELAQLMPVVVVTHNSTVGASVGADYFLYATKENEGGKIIYRLYSGYPSDKKLLSLDGKTISNHEKTLDSLEAGHDTYTARRLGYEAIKN